MTRPGVPRPRRAIDWPQVHRRLERLQAAVERGWQPTAEEGRLLLRARARTLARPSASEGSAGPTLEVIEFRVAQEAYAIESAHVAEVFPLTEMTRLPCTPAFVRGIVNVRGEIVSVVDLKQFFGLPEQGITDLNRVILLQGDPMSFGILADRVEGVRTLAAERLQPGLPTLTDRRRDYLKGIAEGRMVVLDVAKLLADPRMVVEEEVAD